MANNNYAGTKTEKNLWEAFAGESQARNKYTYFASVAKKEGSFTGVEEDIKIVGFINCGGCPGKKAVLRAREMVKRGADTICFTTCITKGTPIGFACPFAKKMMDTVAKDLGENIRILDYSHEAK